MEEDEQQGPGDKPARAIPAHLQSRYTYEIMEGEWVIWDSTEMRGIPHEAQWAIWRPPTASAGGASGAGASPASGLTEGQAKVRLPIPPPFTGDTSETDPELWVMGAENWLAAAGLPRETWGRHAQSLLRGSALQAYSSLALPLYQASQAPPSWDQVRGLIMTFKKLDTPTVSRAKLLSLRQTGSVISYTQLFNRLLGQVGPDPPSQTDLLGAYLRGLKAATPLNPTNNTLWESVTSAQEFHLTRELAEIKLKRALQFYWRALSISRPPTASPHPNPTKPTSIRCR